MILDQMTGPEVAQAARENLPVVLSVGSTEQHGPHLPLNVDSELPLAVARKAAEEIELVIAPPILYGAKSRPLSGGGEGFPGTFSLSAATLMKVIEEIVAALARSGFRQICVQNWHYENSAYLWEACDLAVASSPGTRVLLMEDPMPAFTAGELDELFPGGFPGWDVEHASIMETSMMLAVRPELVRVDRIIDDEAARHPGWDVLPAPADFIPESGVLWHPSRATREIGLKFLDHTAGKMVEALSTEFEVKKRT